MGNSGKIFCLFVGFLLCVGCYAPTQQISKGDAIEYEKLAQSIFQAEGGNKATYLYGIRSIHYHSPAEAKRICLQTIRNNYRRFKEYGFRTYPCFIEFLQSRYCPATRRNPMQGERWIKNVTYFYYKQGG